MGVTALPDRYAWLDDVVGKPLMITEALALYGIHEMAGPADNPTIIGWAKEVGLAESYQHDLVPWCGLLMAVVARRSRKPIPGSPLWALNWRTFGEAAPRASLGDVLVFEREGGGHVGLYVAEDAVAYHVLGGNEGDAVAIVRIAKRRCVAVRRPIWTVSQPAGVRPFHMDGSGLVSTNEA